MIVYELKKMITEYLANIFSIILNRYSSVACFVKINRYIKTTYIK